MSFPSWLRHLRSALAPGESASRAAGLASGRDASAQARSPGRPQRAGLPRAGRLRRRRDPTDVKAGDFNNDAIPDLVTAELPQQRRQRAPGQRRRHVPAGATLFTNAASIVTGRRRLQRGRQARPRDGQRLRPGPTPSPATGLAASRDASAQPRSPGRPLPAQLQPRRELPRRRDSTEPWVQNQPVVTADFNNDTVLDLAVGNYHNGSSTVSVLLGNADGTFQPALNSATGVVPLSLAVGDFNADGKLDLATANAYDVSVLLGNGDGTFQAPASISFGDSDYPQSVAVGDFNGDGKLDLGVTSNTPYYYYLDYGYANVLLGNGDGSFSGPNITALGYGHHYVGGGGRPQRRRLRRLRDGQRLPTTRSMCCFGASSGYLQGPSVLLHRRLSAIGGRGRPERRRRHRPGDGEHSRATTSACCWATAWAASAPPRTMPRAVTPPRSCSETSPATARSMSPRRTLPPTT